MKYLYTFIAVNIFILLFKIPDTAGFYLTDGNNYLLFAKLLSQGKLLYRDLYLDNFPLMMYISVVYKFLSAGSMQWFNWTSTAEKSVIASLIYLVTYRTWKSHASACLAGLTFLFSYTVMSSSFQLGFYTSVLFLVLSYFCITEKKLALAGAFAACAVLIKAYSIFPAVGLVLLVVQHQRMKSVWFFGAGLVAALVVMLPTIVWAFPQFIEQTIGYGLVRAPSVDKTNLWYAFVMFDFMMLFLVLWNFSLAKKNLFIFSGTLFTVIFLLLYKDIYYAYFSYLPLFAALGVGYLLEEELPLLKVKLPKAIYVTVLVLVALISFTTYLRNDRFQKHVANEDTLFAAVKKEKPDAIYAHAIVGNGVSYRTGIPVYKGDYDITTAYFTNGKADKTETTKELMKSRTLLLLYTYKHGDQTYLDGSITDTKVLTKAGCKTVYTQFLQHYTDEIDKELSVVRCY